MSVQYLTYTIHTSPDHKASTVDKLSFLYSEIYMIADEFKYRLQPYKYFDGPYKMKCSPNGPGYDLNDLKKENAEFREYVNERYAIFAAKRDYISSYENEADNSGRSQEDQKKYVYEVASLVRNFEKCLNRVEIFHNYLSKSGFYDGHVHCFADLKPENRNIFIDHYLFERKPLIQKWIKDLNDLLDEESLELLSNQRF